MAGETDKVIELEDDGVVTIDVGEDTELAAAADALSVEPAPKEKPPVVTQRASKPSAADEAAAVLTQSLKTAEEGRRAAEATALAERREREATQRTLAQRDQETQQLRETAADAELRNITTGIESATRTVEALTGEFERAAEAGDFKTQGAINAKLAKAAATLDRLETGKANFETRKPAPTTEGRVVEAQPSSLFERYVAGFAPKAQTWLRAHPECVPADYGGNATKNASMMAGHFDALAKGLPEGSDDYFRVIEERAGYREPVSAAAEVTLAGERSAPKPQQRRPVPSAPVSRDGEGTGAQDRKSVRLTPQQQEVALISYRPAKPGEDEATWKAQAFGSYARELLKAQAEGKIGRLTH